MDVNSFMPLHIMCLHYSEFQESYVTQEIFTNLATFNENPTI